MIKLALVAVVVWSAYEVHDETFDDDLDDSLIEKRWLAALIGLVALVGLLL